MTPFRALCCATALLLASCSDDPTCTPTPCTAGVCGSNGCGADCPCPKDASVSMKSDAAVALPDGGEQGADAAALPDVGSPGDTGAAEPDASSFLPDASSAGLDASAAGPDASSVGLDASSAGLDASAAGRDSSLNLPDGAVMTITQIASGDDALASYLINASPAAWNIFHGENVPLGRHFDTAHVSYHTALRFPGLQIPPNATILSAKVSFWPTNAIDSSKNLYINIYAEKTSNSPPFDPTNYNSGRPDQRLKTSAFFDHWLVRCNDSCTDFTEYDCPQRKADCWNATTEFTCPKDLKALVQEVVNLPGWASGNALSLLLINVATDQDGAKYQNNRTFTGYDPVRGTSFSPRLVVHWVP